jgi:hypothetical protein
MAGPARMPGSPRSTRVAPPFRSPVDAHLIRSIPSPPTPSRAPGRRPGVAMHRARDRWVEFRHLLLAGTTLTLWSFANPAPT